MVFSRLIDYYRSHGGLIEISARLLSRVLAGAGAEYRLFRGQNQVEFPEVEVPISRLPAPFEGFRIAQVSDPHHSGYTRIEDLERLVEAVNQRKPDLVVLTGDYVSQHGRFATPCLEAFQNLEAPFGIYGILGNHDYYEGVSHTRKAFDQVDIPLLVNEHVVIEKDGSRIVLVGVDDPGFGEPDLDAALTGAPDGIPVVLLCHHPDFVETIGPGRVNYVISGHTHGGLVNFPLIGPLRVPSKLGRKYLVGLRQGPHVPVFISRGVGAAVVPFRLNCPPEVPFHRLTRED